MGRRSDVRDCGASARWSAAGLSILTIILCGDKPWLFFALQAVIFAVGLFLSVTTTIPYAVIIALFTFVIATPLEQADPEASLQTALWRILLTGVGVVLGTLGQMLLWPERPEKLLLQDLSAHLRRGEGILERLQTRRVTAVLPSAPLASNVSAAIVAGQLDLLASAEAGAPQLRQYHAQQVKLITDIELIFGLIVRLERLLNNQPSPLPETLHVRLQKIQDEMARLRHELKQGSPPPTAMICEPADSPANIALVQDSPAAATLVQKLERCLQLMPASMAFLEMQKNEEPGLDRVREPIAPGNYFTPACSLSNTAAVQYALKGTLAASACYVLYQALNWPGLSTCVVTAVIAMQSSFGASIQKSLLRLLGAILGAGNVARDHPAYHAEHDHRGLGGCRSRRAVFRLRLDRHRQQSRLLRRTAMRHGRRAGAAEPFGADPRISRRRADRILGIMIGVVMMGFVSLALWPNFAGKKLREKLSHAMRALANISRKMHELARDKFDLVTGQSHKEITAALALYDESLHEFGAQGATDADRAKSLALISRLQEIFLSLLAISRRRTTFDPNTLPIIWQQHLQTLDESIAKRLEILADAETRPTFATLPDPDQSLVDFKNLLNEPATLAEADARLPHQLADLAPFTANSSRRLKICRLT